MRPAIDYTALPPLKHDSSSQHVPSGRFKDLPKETCPICHLRLNAMKPLDDDGIANDISLPSFQMQDGSKEETRIYVPTQSDCWGGCQWCYYCIASELVKSAEVVKEQLKQGKEANEGWDCLRCGGTVTRAWRMGPDPVAEASLIDEEGAEAGDLSVDTLKEGAAS